VREQASDAESVEPGGSASALPEAATPASEAYVWEGRPRPRPLLASDWVFYAQWILALAVVAMILPSRSMGVGPLQTWPWVLPLLGLVAAGFHVVRRRSRHLAVSLDALWVTEGVFWVRTRRLPCPEAKLVRLRGGSLELQGSGGERHELVGLTAIDTGALREGLARARGNLASPPRGREGSEPEVLSTGSEGQA